MSNTLVTSSPFNIREFKERYLDLIAQGFSEQVALDKLSTPKAVYLRLVLEDADFVKDIDEARKSRAEFWISEIARGVNEVHSKDEVPGERLRFDKLAFLAKADNPDRYGSNRKSDININLGQFKLLPPEEALKALAQDPFAIEAEVVEATIVKEDTELL
jgi:hypothetical protein